MGYFAFVDNASGYVSKVVFHGDGGTPPAEDGFLIIETDAGCFASPDSRLAHRDGELVFVSLTITAEEAWAKLRETRNYLLKSTDWTQGADVPETIKSAYVAYRQALRDLPANTADPLNPAWPAAPTL